MENLDFLINYLLNENTNIKIDKMPTSKEEKRNLWRSLCNIREPKPIDEKYLQKEKEFLEEELQKKNITKAEDIEPISDTIEQNHLENSKKICLWQGDITTLKIEAIVNAGNSQGLGCFVPCHKCIDNQIHTNAGTKLRVECNEIMKKKNYLLETGKAFITKGYNLPAKYIIHTVGPIIQEGVTKLQEQQLAECYINSLKLAIENNIKTIAFPCISTGEFRFPKEQACRIALFTVDEFLKKNKFEKVIFNVYSEEDYEIYERNIRKIKTN